MAQPERTSGAAHIDGRADRLVSGFCVECIGRSVCGPGSPHSGGRPDLTLSSTTFSPPTHVSSGLDQSKAISMERMGPLTALDFGGTLDFLGNRPFPGPSLPAPDRPMAARRLPRLYPRDGL